MIRLEASKDLPKTRSTAPAGLPGYARLFPILIVAAILCAYANSISGVFLFDDQRYIIENPRIGDLWSLGTVLSHRRPILDLSLAINNAIHGMDPRWFHVGNIIIHMLAALTFYGLVRRALALTPLQRQSATVAVSVVLLWSVHPLGTQSVTYIIQRSEALAGLFYLLTMYGLVRGAASRRGLIWYAGSIAACALGMGSKGVLVTAPLVALLFDRAYLSPSFAEALRRRWVLYLGLAATISVLFICDVAPGVLSTTRTRVTMGFSLKDCSPWDYALTQVGVFLRYMALTLWPRPLCLDYVWPVASLSVGVVMAGAAVAVILLATIYTWIRRPGVGFVAVWGLLILAPTTSFIPIHDAAFEHRMYLPLASVIVFVVLGTLRIRGLIGQRLIRNRGAVSALATLLVCAAVLVLAYRTVERNGLYHSREVMWRDVVMKRPDNARAWDCLAEALDEAGRREEAMSAIRRILELNPQDAHAHFHLGVALEAEGQFDEAVQGYQAALSIEPLHAKANLNLGVILARQGRPQEAVARLRRAAEDEALLAEVYFNLCAALLQMGRLDEAVQECRKSVDAAPKRYESHFNLGLALHALGQLAEAAEALAKATRLAPGNAHIRFVYATVLAEVGRTDEAIRQLELVLSMSPQHSGAIQALSELRDR